MDDVIIVGAGIGGLTLGLALHEARIPCRIFESAPEIKAVGVGINLLPHATKELAALGLEQALAKVAITTTDATFFNRFGQLIYQEPLGLAAGYDHPQFSIHRGDLQRVLLDAFVARAGCDRLLTGHHCVGVEQDPAGVTVTFSDGPGGGNRSTARGRMAARLASTRSRFSCVEKVRAPSSTPTPLSASSASSVARIDYAINGGDTYIIDSTLISGVPGSFAAAATASSQ
jgi:2-polyprenyl-6-methoxyphenol hydroxylase-like FAD-dependent oxidoreductase